MDIKSIILAGDSAGGHLAVAVSFLAAIRGFRRPDAILVHYPVLAIDSQRFFPSMLLSMDEELLSQPFMKFCLACFIRNGGNPGQSPILSPIVASPKLLNLLPQMRIFACEIDSLRDQALLFCHKIILADEGRSKDRVKLIYMREYIHGFCNLD
jgi:acetyl esterase/lipase